MSVNRRNTGKIKITPKKVIAALHKSKGAVYLAAKYLKCSHMSVYDVINKNPEVAEIKKYYEEEVTDIAELKLRESVINGLPWAIKYQLSTKGKDRGYTEKQQIDLGQSEELKPVKIIIESDNKGK